MRAYSMDLRERALLDSDAGMKAADVAAKYRGEWVVGAALEAAPPRHGRGGTACPAPRPAAHARAAPAHAGGAEGRARHPGERPDDLARRPGPGGDC